MILVPPERIRAYTEQGWWGRHSLWDLFEQRLSEHPQAEAVVDAPNRAEFAHGAPQRLSWAALAERVDMLCADLLDAAIVRDDIVVTMLPNTVDQFIAYLACARLGVVVTPVPVQYREHELDHVLGLAKPAAAITYSRIGKAEHPHAAAAMFLELSARHPSLRTVLAWGDAAPAGTRQPRTQPLDAAGREQVREAARRAAVDANDCFTLCWTSGTEALPKAVPRSHNEWLPSAQAVIEAAEIRRGARLLNPFPLVNMSGFSSAFATWLLQGATVVQHHPFDLGVFVRQIRDERIDYTVAPPTILNTLLHNEQLLQGIDFGRLNRIGSGSAPLSEWMVRGFAERHGVQIVNYFGSNEGAALSGCPADIPDPALRAQYFPRAGVAGYEWKMSTTRKIRTRLVDLETGADIDQAGQPGELRFAGPTIFSGYFRAPGMTERAFDDQGYYCTGDLFELAGDRLQYYRYVGRSKDLVIRGGMNISSEEIEGLLVACPGVRDVAVVGVPDERLGEKLCACIVPAPEGGPDLEAVKHYLTEQRRVAIYKLPEYLMEIDALPRNPVGKILKRVLRERARQKFAQPGGGVS